MKLNERSLSVGLIIAALAALTHAQTPRDFAIDLRAVPSESPPSLTLSWSIRRQGNITAQKIHRRLKGETAWTLLSTLETNQTSYADTTAEIGVDYEYWMQRTYTGISPTTAMGYLSAGINVPMVEGRGKLLLVIDDTMVAPLAPEIEQLQADLTGEGWTVQTLTALRTATAATVKAQILAAYNADPANVKMVYLLGHVPVPYSGSMAPDGHGDHSGAWPCDGYYGELDGTWTDTSVNNTTASDARNKNIPGDGKFDQSYFPNRLELMVGRVDLHSMTRAPSSAVTETALLRRYLRKAHDFRMKQGAYTAIPRRSMVRDGFGHTYNEGMAMTGWAWAFTSTGLVVDEVPSGQWFSANYAGGKSYLVGYGNGAGGYESASTVGNTVNFGLQPSRVVFTSLFGSYFGDWDRANNFLRAPLAGNATEDSLGLVCFWAARPHWFTHHLGMNETLGFCARISQNNSLSGGGDYTPTGLYSKYVHVSLMGDPALRMYPVEPARRLTAVSANGQVALTWAASTEPDLLGYHIYRAASAAGPYTRLTASPQAGTSYTDTSVSVGTSYSYMVRTLKRESTPGGTFENLSVGTPVTLTVRSEASAIPGAPAALAVSQSSTTEARLTWTGTSADETGFRVERKVNAGGSYTPIGTVGANVTNFTDNGVFAHGNVYHYRVVATNAAGDSLPSAFASFDAHAGFFDLPVTRQKVSKTAGSTSVTINRFGGVTGAVSVNFATSDSSALAGTHYQPTNGTLTWADGDLAPKTVTVPILNAAPQQAARQFRLTFSSPSAGASQTVNAFASILVQNPAATLAAPWSQTIVGSITDSSAAVTESDLISSVTIGGSGLTAAATSDAGQFIYQSFTGDGVLTAYIPAGIPADGNARYALMARASTANNAIMATAVSSSSTGFGTRFFSRSSAGATSSLMPSTANTLTLARWLRLSRSGNLFAAETSADGTTWTFIAGASLATMPATALWGFFHTSSDWSVTALGNYHLAQAQNVALEALPPPATPSGLTASTASSTSAAVRWEPASFASGYRVERRVEGGSFEPIASVAAGAGTNYLYTNTGLDVNTAYAYRVVATNAVGESAPSAPAYVATSADALIIVTADADATVRRDLADTPLGTQTNLTVAAYDPSTYQFLTNAAKSYLRFDLSGLGPVTAASLKLALIDLREYDTFGYTYLSVGVLSESSDTWDENGITWNSAPQNNTASYGFNAPIVSLGTFYAFADDTMTPGDVFPLTLNTANLNSNRGANQLVTLGLYHSGGAHLEWASREHPTYAPPTLELIVTTNIPPRASFLTAAPGNGWSVNLAWQDNATNETGFVIERRVGDGAFAVLQTFGANVTAFTDATTSTGVTYTYRVRAFNAAGPSDWTPEVTITAATLDTAVSTVWDGGGADTRFTTATNWDFNTRPAFDGTATLTFGTGGSSASVDTNAFVHGLLLNRNADFTFTAGGGTLALSSGGLRALLPSATSRAYTLAPNVVLVSNQTWAVTNNGAGVATLTVSGTISDGGSGASLTKSGNGVLVLAGDNSYGGLTTVKTGGVVRVSHANALGSPSGATVVENGGWLELSGGVTLAEPLTLTGDAALGYAGTLRNTGGSNVLTGPVTCNGARLKVNSGSLDVLGGISGSGCVLGANGGLWIRVSELPLTIGTGTFYAHNSSGTIILNVAGNAWGTMDVASGTVRTEVPGAFPPASTVQMNTSTTLDLNGNDQTIGQLKNANANVGSRTVTSAAPATLTINQSATSYFDGVLSGALALVKDGAGTLTLSNTVNTLSGPVTVRGGTLAAFSLGAVTNVTVEGGTLSLPRANVLTNTATLSIADGGARLALAAGVTQTVARLYLGGVRKGRGLWGSAASGATYTSDAHFSGNGVLFVTEGESTVWDAGGADTAFSTPENWDFDVLPAFDGSATLSLAAAGSLATLDLPVSLPGLRFDRDADFTLAAGGGTLTLGADGLFAAAPAATPRAYTLAAPVTLATAQRWCATNAAAGATTLTVSGAISGDAAGTLTFVGNGLLALAGSNRYDGATSVASGSGVRVAHSHALGSTAGATILDPGAWLEVCGGVAVPEALTLPADTTPGGSGNLRSADGHNVWLGPVTRTGIARIRTLPGSRLTLSGGGTGAYNLYVVSEADAETVFAAPLNLGSTASTRVLYAHGAGTLTLAASGNTFGRLEIGGSTVRVAAPNALPAALALYVGTSYDGVNDGAFDLNGHDVTVSQLRYGNTGTGRRIVTSATPATLTVDGSTSTYYDGWLTGAVGLTKKGGSTLTFNGTNNTYTGTTLVSGGTLDIYDVCSFGNSPEISVTGGTLRLRGTQAILDTAVLRIAGGTAKVRVDSGTEVVGALYLGGKRQRRGTYGASTSNAQFKDNTYFNTSGTGVIEVTRGIENLLLVR